MSVAFLHDNTSHGVVGRHGFNLVIFFIVDVYRPSNVSFIGKGKC